MRSEAMQQNANVTPPRRGACLNLTLDGTARAYDLTALDLGGFAPKEGRIRQRVFVTLQAITADCFFYFSDVGTVDLDNAATIAAGGTLAYTTAQCSKLTAGQSIRLRIDRQADRFLVVKGSAAGNLLIVASSESFGD